MSHQLSECPSCRRTFVGDGPLSDRKRCRACGTPLVLVDGTAKEAEVRDRLYGPGVFLASVTRVVGTAEKGDAD